VDIRRFNSQVHNNSKFLSARVAETLGLHYQITWPKRELESGRGLRKSPLYSTHERLNACFGSKFGWERVNFYVPSHQLLPPEQWQTKDSGISMIPYSYGRQWWFDLVGQEHLHCRSSVTVFDITSFSKILVQGEGALTLLQELCVNNVDVNVGKLVYTTMCNSRGGIETDLTICRLQVDQFLLITSTSQGTRDIHWIQSNLYNKTHGMSGTGSHHHLSVTVSDVTSSESVLSVMGPRSRELLSHLTTHDLSHEAFPFGTSQRIDIGQANVRAHRITYVGEVGYELYIPSETAQLVYDSLFAAAKAYQIPFLPGGYFAIDSLRLEKGYRAWGHDITPNDTPLEAGLGFTIDWNKPHQFIGKEALWEQKQNGVRKKLVSVIIGDRVLEIPSPPLAASSSFPYPYGGEPLFRNGVLVGYLTSAGYGYSLQKAIGLAYISSKNLPLVDPHGMPPIVDNKFIREGSYEIELSDGRYHCQVTLKPPHDPLGKNIHR
jgi:sarcosine dehydrogenase